MAVLGLARLRKKFRRIPEIARDEIGKAMEAGATEMVSLAKNLVPRDSGDLANSIGWTWGDAPKGSMVLGTVRASKTGDMRITIYAGSDEVFWARWVEFGTSGHVNGGLFDGSKHPGTPAQSFFFPAYRAVRRRIKSRVSRAITKSAKRAAAGG